METDDLDAGIRHDHRRFEYHHTKVCEKPEIHQRHADDCDERR